MYGLIDLYPQEHIKKQTFLVFLFSTLAFNELKDLILKIIHCLDLDFNLLL